MFEWRFEYKNYKFFDIDNNVIIYKEFKNKYDILAIYKKNIFNFKYKNEPIAHDAKIIVMENWIKDKDNKKIYHHINATYFPIKKNIDYDKISINLLMSDVF